MAVADTGLQEVLLPVVDRSAQKLLDMIAVSCSDSEEFIQVVIQVVGMVEISIGSNTTKIKVEKVSEFANKDDAPSMYSVL